MARFARPLNMQHFVIFLQNVAQKKQFESNCIIPVKCRKNVAQRYAINCNHFVNPVIFVQNDYNGSLPLASKLRKDSFDFNAGIDDINGIFCNDYELITRAENIGNGAGIFFFIAN